MKRIVRTINCATVIGQHTAMLQNGALLESRLFHFFYPKPNFSAYVLQFQVYPFQKSLKEDIQI